MANKSQAYSKNVYREYLDWFADLVKTEAGRTELFLRKAYLTHDAEGKRLPPVPYEYSMWYLMDQNSGCDFEVMEQRAKTLRRKNAYKISEAVKHVGGNPANPLLNPEYIANARNWHESNRLGRESDPEWSASDRATNEAHRISESGPKLYAEWESRNTLVKGICSETPVTLHKPPGFFKRILRAFQWLDDHGPWSIGDDK